MLPEHPPGDPVEIANQRQGQEQKQQIEATMERLKYKVSRYEEAVKTGVLTWEEKECK